MSLREDLERAVLHLAVEGTRGEARLRFSGDEVFFEGHFPSAPVLPAVVQVSAALMLAGRILGREVSLGEVTRAKFTNPAGPGHELTLTVSTDEREGRTRVKATVREGNKEIAELNLRVV